MKEEIRYGSWIRVKRLAFFAAALVPSLALSAIGFARPLFLLALAPAAFFGYISLIVGMSYWRFDRCGGGWQDRIHRLLAERIVGQGRVLDIGCGSGHLAIMIAKGGRGRRLVGLDYWGRDWEYSLEQCRTNARLEGIGGVEFVEGSASRLDFAGGSFDQVVSCLTFHEVAGPARKELCVAEALRVLKPGGRFVFLDLFDDRGFFPDADALSSALKEGGGTVEENRSLGEVLDLPFPLRGKRALGRARLIVGRKTASGPV